MIDLLQPARFLGLQRADTTRPEAHARRGMVRPGSAPADKLDQFESGSGSAIAPALSVGFGVRGAGTSESRSRLSGPSSARLSGPGPTAGGGLTKIGPCSGHS